MLINLLMTVVSISSVGSIEPGKPEAGSGVKPDDEARTRWRDREEDAGRRAERRERWRRYREASPEERGRMRNERMVEMATRAYELDESQKELVRTEIEIIRAERRQAMGPKAEEYDKLREQMFDRWRQRRRDVGDDVNWREMRRRMRDNPEYQKLRERMREIEREHPFDWQDSLDRVETLLPAEQAAKGRARLDERFSRRRERRERARAERLKAEMEAKVAELKVLSERDPFGNDAKLREARLQVLLADARKRVADENLSEDVRKRILEMIERAERASKATEAPKPPPLHPWEKHVREFIETHDLTAAQQAAAMSILKDVRNRAGQIEQVNESKIAEAKRLEDKAEREKRLAKLNEPIERLFDELQIRLDGLLTAAQRKKAGN